jgi:hypothetical protein
LSFFTFLFIRFFLVFLSLPSSLHFSVMFSFLTHLFMLFCLVS